MTTHVAIYARHSTDKQSHSTRDQIARCRKHCEAAGYEVAFVFQDEAVSGASVINRPGMSDMIDAAVAGHFDHVVSEDLSRFSRDLGDIANFYRKLQYLDITLETVSEGLINELHIGLKGTMNALYLKDLGDKTRRGMIAAVLKGAVPGGRTYGYDAIHQFDDKGEMLRGQRKINESEAEVVRFIFDRYSQGATLAEICASLNRQRIPSPKGGKWGNTTLIGQADRKTGLLRQTLYKGVVTFNRMMYRKNPETGLRQSFMRPESEWVRVPVPELVIIDEEQFERVQKLIEERSSLRKQRRLLNQVLDQADKPRTVEKRERQKRARARKPKKRQVNLYIFSGKLWCAEHDTAISVIRKRVYRCPVKTCSHRYVKHEALMGAALEAMKHMPVDELKIAISAQRQTRERLVAKITHKDVELDKHREAIRNVLDAVAVRRLTPETDQYLDQCEANILRCKHELKKLTDQLASIPDVRIDEAETVLHAFHKSIEPLRRAPDDQRIIGRIFKWFNRFTVSPDTTITIQYNWHALLIGVQKPQPRTTL